MLLKPGIDHEKIDLDFDESNYQFLSISNIFKNENYGEVFIIFNKPSPLYLRVKSKMANLLLLNKKHIMYLSSNYSNIWNRLFKKSLINMITLKERTIEVVKKYSIRYDIKYVAKLGGDLTNKGNLLVGKNIHNFSGVLKNALSNKIVNIKNNAQLSNYNNNDDIENKNEKNSDKSINENEKSSSNKTISKKNTNEKNNQSKKGNNKLKRSFINSKSHQNRSTNYSSKFSDKIRKLEKKLKQEKKKRLYYQKLYEELNEKNKYLYTQLLSKSINSSSMYRKSLNDSEIVSDSKLNKIILNDINNNNLNNNNNINNNIPKKITSRAFSIRFKNMNKISTSSSRVYSPTKNKIGLEFKGRNKSKSITQNYFNITKNINIINKFEKKDNKEKKSNANFDKNLSKDNNNLEKISNNGKKNTTQIKNEFRKNSLNNDSIQKKKSKTNIIKAKNDNK